MDEDKNLKVEEQEQRDKESDVKQNFDGLNQT